MFALSFATRLLAVSGRNSKAHLFYNLALRQSFVLTSDANFCQKEIPNFVTFGSFVGGSK